MDDPPAPPAANHQQGMSPNDAAGVTPAPDGSALAVVPVSTGEGVPGNAGIGDESVAMRTMSVAVATNQMTREPGWGSPSVQSATYVHASQGFVDSLGQPGLEAQNAAQAWTMEGTRRSVPTWIQRLGAFFQEVRAQQAFPATWAPSAMGSPATPTTRRPTGSPAPEGGGQGQSSLLSRQQREQFRRMEQRAPLLYGSSPQQPNSSTNQNLRRKSNLAPTRGQLRREHVRGCARRGQETTSWSRGPAGSFAQRGKGACGRGGPVAKGQH